MAKFINRPPRVDLRREAVLIDSEGNASPVTILDVSATGFRVQVTEPPRIDELVTLRVDRCPDFEGQICWALGDEAGGIFLIPVDPDRWTAQTAEEIGMTADKQDRDGAERRQGEDRREGEDRRWDEDRRHGGRTDNGRREVERRQGDRREEDKRS